MLVANHLAVQREGLQQRARPVLEPAVEEDGNWGHTPERLVRTRCNREHNECLGSFLRGSHKLRR